MTEIENAGSNVIVAKWAAKDPPLFSRANPLLPVLSLFVTAILVVAFLIPNPFEKYLSDVPGPLFQEMHVAASLAPALVWALYLFALLSLGVGERIAAGASLLRTLSLMIALVYWTVAPTYGMATQLGYPDLMERSAGSVFGPGAPPSWLRSDLPHFLWFQMASSAIGMQLGLFMARLRRRRPER